MAQNLLHIVNNQVFYSYLQTRKYRKWFFDAFKKELKFFFSFGNENDFIFAK